MRYGEEARYADDDFVGAKGTGLSSDETRQVQDILRTSDINQSFYPQITADQNDYPLLDSVTHLFTTDASHTITGFANVGAGLRLVANVGAQDLVLANNNGSSAGANRIFTHTGANLTINAAESLLIYYDYTNICVRTVGGV